MRLDGKIILVCGGAAGIGRAAAIACHKAGAQILIADFQEAAGVETAVECSGKFFKVDITDEESVKALQVSIAMTVPRLDVLIHTAGILEGAYETLDDFSSDTFRRVLDVNVNGTFLISKYMLPLLRKGSKPVVILTSSGAATGGSSSFAYGSSKGGVNSFSITLARELEKEGIRVNVLSPGNINTAMKRSVIESDVKKHGGELQDSIEKARLGSPQGIAPVLVFLASDDADYVRGIIQTR